MWKFFDFWDPLERRYIFNSFLVVVALVEVLIFVFTLIWQIDEGVLGGPVKVVPFPWKEYLLAAFAAPLVLLLLFGLIIRGFQAFAPEGGAEPGADRRELRGRHRVRFFGSLAAFLGVLALFFYGRELLALTALLLKTLGLGGTYVLVALLALATLYFSLRLVLRYRLQKGILEYQYLAYLARRHGTVLSGPDPGVSGLLSQPATDTRTSPVPSEPPGGPVAPDSSEGH